MTTSATTAVASHCRRRSSRLLPPALSSLILLVAHELAFRMNSANELLDEGYDIVESESASEAMSILRGRNDFDAMIVDIDTEHIPGGLALIRYASSHHPSMRILIRSAGMEVQAESNEMDADFLSRPYPAGGLVQRIRGLLKQGALAHRPTPALFMCAETPTEPGRARVENWPDLFPENWRDDRSQVQPAEQTAAPS